MKSKKVLLVIAAMMVIAGNAWAADQMWFGGDVENGGADPRNWFEPANWNADPLPSGPVPGLLDKAKIDVVWGNPGPIIAAAGAAVNQLYVAESAGALPGAQTLEVTTNGVLAVTLETVLGYSGNGIDYDDGTLFVTGGTVNCNQHLFVGFDPGATGRLHIDSGTVNVAQMFGLSWNGGDGFAQLDGGILQTEEFTFEKVAGGTAAMDITGGEWIQKHFWWDKIRALVWNGKITGYAGSGGDRSNVVVTWNALAEETSVTALVVPDIVVVKQAGGGDYTTIQAALNDAGLAMYDVIEVQDNATYTENPTFPDVNYLTLQAGDGFRPTITLSGSAAATPYLNMVAVGQTIQGFDINFSGSAYASDSNSVMILSDGGASTVRDCDIVGPTIGWIRGITNVATIEDTAISSCRTGVVCDINEVNAGFRYSISGSHIYDNRLRGISFYDCNAVVDDCLIEDNGGPLGSSNVLVEGNGSDPGGEALNLLITNSMIRGAQQDRNVCLEAPIPATVTIEDSIIMDAVVNDEILIYRGTLNLNRCIIKKGTTSGVIGACLNVSSSAVNAGAAVVNIDHCSIEGSGDPGDVQWAIFTVHQTGTVDIRNSILTGYRGLLENQPDGGQITTNWNDNYCQYPIADVEQGFITHGPDDIVPAVDPFYIQVDNADLDTFFALQPYSPVINADEVGSYMGAKGVISGYEDWPPDFDDDGDVDFEDFAILGVDWPIDNNIPALPKVVIDDFESYATTAALLGTWEVVDWPTYTADKDGSTLTLRTNPADANSPTKAMRWVYEVNELAPFKLDTEILMVLASDVDLGLYGTSSSGNLPRLETTTIDRIRIALKRHAGNSLDSDTFLYVKFLNDIYGTYGMGGSDLLGPDKKDIAKQCIGGSTSSHPDEYYRWNINLDRTEDAWTWGHRDLEHVGAIILGVRSHPDPNVLDPNTIAPGGQGTLDVDDVTLVDGPGCSARPAVDLDDNCRVTLEDVKIFTDYWLGGK